jgi:hypothetical protein
VVEDVMEIFQVAQVDAEVAVDMERLEVLQLKLVDFQDV